MSTIGVAIPTYQHRDFIALTLRSATEQTLPPDVVVVVDDCSDDGTAEVAESLRASFPALVVIRHATRLGPTRTTHDAIAACRTDFVAVLDGDDVMRPQRLQRQLEAFADSRVRVVGSLVQPIDTAGTPFGEPFGAPGSTWTAIDWVRRGMLAGGSSITVRSPFVNHDTRLTWASDWKFVIDNLLDGSPSVVLDEVLVDYRRHGGSVSTAHRINGLRDHLLMCSLLLESSSVDDVLRQELHRQRAMKKCQLGEAAVSSGATSVAVGALTGALVESRGRLAREVAAAVRRGRRQQ